MYGILSTARIMIFSEFFTDLAAGWFGALFIFPSSWLSQPPDKAIQTLFFNCVLGILALEIAVFLKKKTL